MKLKRIEKTTELKKTLDKDFLKMLKEKRLTKRRKNNEPPKYI